MRAAARAIDLLLHQYAVQNNGCVYIRQNHYSERGKNGNATNAEDGGGHDEEIEHVPSIRPVRRAAEPNELEPHLEDE